MKLRITPQTLLVLDAFLVGPEEWKYGYDISRNTGLKSGTLYPILMRMAERRLLETAWESGEPGKPPRHMYRFTPEGLKFARTHPADRRASPLDKVALGQIALAVVGLAMALVILLTASAEGSHPCAGNKAQGWGTQCSWIMAGSIMGRAAGSRG